jgi:predicted  nucleic acid-binding Zn-ribbon protein
LREQLRALEHLQELDLKIDSLKKQRTALPNALKTVDDSLNRLKATTHLKKTALEEVDKVNRQTRAALDLNNDRLTRANSKLEGVHNTQEFQAANKEIEQLKKMNLSLEEQTKKSVSDTENLNKELIDLGAQLEKVQADRDSQAAVFSGQTGQLDGEIKSLTDNRTQYTSIVDTRTVALYDRVRAARAGLGIVPAVGGRCKGCNMVVPPQLYNEIHRANQLHSCPSCHRILFVPDPAGPGASDSSETDGGRK